MDYCNKLDEVKNQFLCKCSKKQYRMGKLLKQINDMCRYTKSTMRVMGQNIHIFGAFPGITVTGKDQFEMVSELHGKMLNACSLLGIKTIDFREVK